jgi:biotin transport system substrate-specific component
MCAAVIVLSSWLAVPFTVSFTLQTLAIFVISEVFSLRISITAVLIYVLLGLCGLPVFSGFSGGIAALLGPTGGFIIGFLVIPLIMFLFPKKGKILSGASMISALLVCYTLGTVWYLALYSGFTAQGILSAITVCVFPFILPDLAKITIAVILSSRIKSIIKFSLSRRKQ